LLKKQDNRIKNYAPGSNRYQEEKLALFVTWLSVDRLQQFIKHVLILNKAPRFLKAGLHG